jgi:hypothetical protein
MEKFFVCKLFRIELFSAVLFLSLLLVSCVKSSEGEVSPQLADADMLVTFSPMLTAEKQTRAVYPEDAEGGMDDSRLQYFGFGVYAQYAGNTAWTSYTEKSTTPFNFMWNQNVSWDGTSAWKYSPVKYWPNDNNPADDQGATGSQTHSYLNFFAYAPVVQAADLPATGHDDATADGIVEISANSVNVSASYIYYRTSLEKPFGTDKSIDLLWATRRNCYKYDSDGANDDGRVTDQVNLLFKHALAKLDINVRAMVDRTADHTSPAYSTDVNGNTRIFIDNVSITTPTYYPEGKLKIASEDDTPVWDYTDISTSKTKFLFGSDIDLYLANVNDTKDLDNVKYSLRYAAPNVPTNATIDDDDHDDIDDNTGLTLAETARAAFDEMEAGVIATEQQLSANYSTFMFCPSAATSDISIRAVYHVVTFDPNLTLNNPKFYSNVTNDITASLGNDDFKFEPNKQYKILLNLGITSVKFEVYELDEVGEYILLSAVVKEWDLKTIEADVE